MIIQWGILSTAHINRRIIPAILQSDRGNLLAVASRDLSKAKTYAMKWQIPKAYGNYEELLKDKEIDIIYISLPNHLHTEWIIRSLEAGKNVLCEKPMCLTLEEFNLISKAQKETGLCVMEAFMHLHHPQTHLWKSIIDKGMLGEIHTMKGSFSFNLDRGRENYRWDPDAGGGALWDVGVYPISLFQYLYDETPKTGVASMHIENGIDLSTAALLEFDHGRTAQFFVSFRSAWSSETIIHGSEAQLYISHPYSNVDACEAHIRSGDTIENIDVPRQYLYSGEVENMHDMILNGKSPGVTLETSRGVLETILKLRGEVSK